MNEWNNNAAWSLPQVELKQLVYLERPGEIKHLMDTIRTKVDPDMWGLMMENI